MAIDTVVMTGAAGAIGSVLRAGLEGAYRKLVLSDIVPIDDLGPGETFVKAELSDIGQVEKVLAGADAVIHLGAYPNEKPFEDILHSNYIGTYNVFEAARRQGVKRMVFASSNHAIGFYPVGTRIGPDVRQMPDGFYGVGKAFGENLACLYFNKWGLESVCLRIGSFQDRPKEPRHLSTWLSHGDTVRLVQAALDAPEVGYTIVYGASNNDRGWWDNPGADVIGYRPQDNAETFAEEILSKAEPADPDDPAERFQGGFIAAIDYGKQ